MLRGVPACIVSFIDEDAPQEEGLDLSPVEFTMPKKPKPASKLRVSGSDVLNKLRKEGLFEQSGLLEGPTEGRKGETYKKYGLGNSQATATSTI